jgi:hypothetical protein
MVISFQTPAAGQQLITLPITALPILNLEQSWIPVFVNPFVVASKHMGAQVAHHLVLTQEAYNALKNKK